MTTIIQISDTHLFVEGGVELRDVDTRRLFCDVLNFIDEHWPDAQRLIITGDIAHDEEPRTYGVLKELLRGWSNRVLVVPGNHDNRAGLRSAFGSQGCIDKQRVGFRDEIDGWQLLGLDTHVPGEVAGRLEPDHLRWCADQLKANLPTIVFMHHPPVRIGSAWMDNIALQDPEDFAGVVAKAADLRAISCGHIHQEFCGELNGVMVLGTPSTGPQFKPRTATPMHDSCEPGFRVFKLDGNSLTTQIVRLPAQP